MRREPGMLLSDPFNRRLDRTGHAQSCALRGRTGTAAASSASDSPAKLFAERFDFVFGLGDALRNSELFGFFELFAEFFKLAAVCSFRLGIKHFASVFRPARDLPDGFQSQQGTPAPTWNRALPGRSIVPGDCAFSSLRVFQLHRRWPSEVSKNHRSLPQRRGHTINLRAAEDRR
jgi:hypothetical protein